MENFYLILVVVLFALAVSDLVVGVSNDAVNFLNSAIGSKAAPKWVIFGVASLGILVGSVFSSGMMEVARKEIFHPDMFNFSEIMIIFLAVMITDVILLDMFNSFGMPTSTTVSIVFELLGSAVAVSLVKISQLGESAGLLSEYINSAKALAIISGILISVVIAFSVGAMVMYLARMVFSYRQHKTLKRYGAIFGGFSIAAMTYFMIIKGAKGATFITPEIQEYFNNYLWQILLYSFIGWAVILQLLTLLFKIDIPKIIVIIGTFGLAMAFAGNDLVNFIGVPLAGYQSFKEWVVQGGLNPDTFNMGALAAKQAAPTAMLLIAGLVMIITLITSKKAKNVVATSIDLSRQGEGEERFGSSAISRALVRGAVVLSESIDKVIPNKVKNYIESRFEYPKGEKILTLEDDAAFDKIRAAINLIVSGILISIGTSLKLPLSTTYVTFMVAMGTSLSDRAWGRDSAVYRVSGVFAVVGGWFLTALMAFTAAFIVAITISSTHEYVAFIFIAIAFFTVYRTQVTLRKKSKEEASDEMEKVNENDEADKIIEKTKHQIISTAKTISSSYKSALSGFLFEERTMMKLAMEDVKQHADKTKRRKAKISGVIDRLQQNDSLDIGHFYVQLIGHMRSVSNSLTALTVPLYEHLVNNHKPFTKGQIRDLSNFISDTHQFLEQSIRIVENEEFEKLEELSANRNELIEKLADLEKAQIKRIKNKEVNTRNSILFFNVLTETKNLLLNYTNLIKAQSDFLKNAQ